MGQFPGIFIYDALGCADIIAGDVERRKARPSGAMAKARRELSTLRPPQTWRGYRSWLRQRAFEVGGTVT